MQAAEPTISKLMPKHRRLPTGFVEPCIPVLAHKPPAGPQWVHEIGHDGYRLIVRRDHVRLFTRRRYDWTEWFSGIAAAAGRVRGTSFTIDGEAAIAGPDGVAAFDELHGRRRLAEVFLWAVRPGGIEREDLRPLPFSKRK